MAARPWDLEIARNSNGERRWQVAQLAARATDHIALSVADRVQARAFKTLHLVAAEWGRADVLLTTDDRFIHRALRVRVLNPTTWAAQELTT